MILRVISRKKIARRSLWQKKIVAVGDEEAKERNNRDTILMRLGLGQMEAVTREADTYIATGWLHVEISSRVDVMWRIMEAHETN